MAAELFIHKMTEHMETARIVQWLVKEGETVHQFQILMEVETDKATVELESPAAGVLKGIRPGAVDGAEVKVGEVIAYIAAADEVVPNLTPLGTEEIVDKKASLLTTREGLVDGNLPVEGIRATPVARRVAKALGIDLSKVQGTGPEGRIKEEDVKAYAETVSRRPSGVTESILSHQPLPTTSVELTHNQQLTGQRMLESVQTAPQFALTLSADMTQALRMRDTIARQAANGLRPSITAILVKAAAEALKHHPRLNAAFKDERIQVYSHINIGVALASGGELVAPVIHDADGQSLAQIARQVVVFQEKGQRMRFTLEDLSGSTFTLSNLGMYGIERFNAILIPGQSAILAVGKIVKTPIVLEDCVIALRPVISLTLTVDHRVLDGVQAAQFLSEIKQILENPSNLV